MYLKSKIYQEDLKNALTGAVNIKALYHKSILVTGATGLIGSFLADLLLYANKTEDAGIEICLLARDKRRFEERFASNLGVRKLHCVFQDVVNPLDLPISPDYIIHAASDGFPAAFREHPVETMAPALFGTYQLLQYARENGTQKFLYVSSGEIYGKTSKIGHAFKEEDGGVLDSMSVRSCYPEAKRCAETLCASFKEQYHVPAGVVRLSHTYGACTSAHDNRATVQFLKRALEGKDIVMNSVGKQMRSYTYVADCVSGILTVLLNGVAGEAYNIANRASQVTIAEFARILAEKAGVNCMMKEPDVCEKREHTPIEYAVLDSGKLERLGWHGQYDIHKGIKNMYDIGKTV